MTTPQPATARPATPGDRHRRVKRGLADMLKGGVIMDVVTPEQARIAEDAGAVAVMALERVPADIRAQGGVARMSDPDMVAGIVEAVSIPVMAKARIGHFVEAQVLQSIGVDYVDESEVLTPADEAHHIDKWAFTVPFVCGATNLGEALRRLGEGAAMIRSKGEAGTGNVVEATRHMRAIRADIRRLARMDPQELYTAAKELQAPLPLVQEVAEAGRLPVVLFTAGGIATPADAAMMMQLGAEGVFVGSGIFKSGDPARRAEAIVKATTFHDDPDVIAKVSAGLGEAMVGLTVADLPGLRAARHPRLVTRPPDGVAPSRGMSATPPDRRTPPDGPDTRRPPRPRSAATAWGPRRSSSACSPRGRAGRGGPASCWACPPSSPATSGRAGRSTAWPPTAAPRSAGSLTGLVGLVVGTVIVWPTLFGTGAFGDGLTLDQCLGQATTAKEMHMCKSQHLSEFNQRYPNAAE